MEKRADFFRLYPGRVASSSMLLFILCLLIGSCDKSSPTLTARNPINTTISYTGIFLQANPHDSTRASGYVATTFDTYSHLFDFSIHWDSLTSLPIAIHFYDHNSIIIDLNVFQRVISDSISGTVALNSQEAEHLAAGNINILIHTIKYPYGEIMASLGKH